jgi:hypothetical protein
MVVKNLVLEFGENESRSDLQRHLDNAAQDGFFLVNVVGRFAFLRTAVTQPRKSNRAIERAVDNAEADAFLMANSHLSGRALAKAFKGASGGTRSYKWFQRRMKRSSSV